MWEVRVEAHFDKEEDAQQALKDMEEAVGKNNGEVQESEAEDLNL